MTVCLTLKEEISESLNKAFLGKKIDVLIEGSHEETELLLQGRHIGQAPDVDGKVIINDTSSLPLAVGQIVKVEITDTSNFDLVGR